MKAGIITFHNSYNCGSMLETYAIMKCVQSRGFETEIIDYSSEGQKELYSTFSKNNSLKNIIKNIVIFPHRNVINRNNEEYEKFKQKNFNLSKKVENNDFSKFRYDYNVAGSDQIWNITIKDYNDAYFLNWVKYGKKIAYAPSFGAKNPQEYGKNNINKYINFIKLFDNVSIREKNGQKWIKEMTGIDVPVLLDPTLLLEAEDYDNILDNNCTPKEEYIFLYCPSFNRDICKFVKKISKKYKLPVIAWSAKSFYIKRIEKLDFELPKYESPAVYLSLIKNAKIIFTTSFHGTIFSTIYKKNFFVLKNGEMFGNDDRVKTLVNTLGIEERLIAYEFNEKYDYMQDVNYEKYNKLLKKEKEKANEYLNGCLEVDK